MAEQSDARKEKIGADAAWEMFREYKTIRVGKGKKYVEFSPTEENREAILKAALGRTGNLRAPTLKMGDKLMVGFNDDMYDRFFNE